MLKVSDSLLVLFYYRKNEMLKIWINRMKKFTLGQLKKKSRISIILFLTVHANNLSDYQAIRNST